MIRRRQQRARPERLTRFNNLLTTWPFRFSRVPEGAAALHPDDIEKLAGDGHYEDRRRLLHVVLEVLVVDDRVDLDATFETLRAARSRRWRADLGRWKVLADRKERIDPELKRRRAAADALDRWAGFRAKWDYLARDSPESLLSRADRVIADLRAPVMSRPALAKGRPKYRPIAARAALARAGVPFGPKGWRQALARRACRANPRNVREALLMAVGLVEYRGLPPE